MMEEKLHNLKIQALGGIKRTNGAEELAAVKIKYLGRKGLLTLAMRSLAEVDPEERPRLGKLANNIKNELLREFSLKMNDFSLDVSGNRNFIDVTRPGKRVPLGHLHPTTQAIDEISDIFQKIGFSRERYPEVETDWYAFESLNMPPEHPARDEWETFFINKNVVLTPHTSSGQAREMEKGCFPIRMINISKCYRRQIDVSHTPMFHQFEGLYIDNHVTVGHLKGVLEYFVKAYFGQERTIRLRPYHFQFTEPSFEIDISCGLCRGKGQLEGGNKCKMCKEGWLELGGAGMVHPNVFKACKIDPKKHAGFAFGWGVERTYMMKAEIKIDDIRILYKNDIRFLKQF